MSTAPVSILPPAEVWDRLDPLSPDLAADPVRHGLADLPYRQLGGPGFERLCYQLLVAQGEVPRFFGRSGQRDYGVDILTEDDRNRTVYQCKNLSDIPSWTALRDAVEQFEADWLGKAGLPRPDAFFYCCPQPLDDIKLNKDWIDYRDAFQQRTGATLGLWDKHYINACLRRLPDLVAGLFSDAYAEVFCGRDDWPDSPWTRVTSAATAYPSLRRFLEHRRDGRIHVGQREAEPFNEILGRSPILAIRGLPGVGKSMTGLELACGLREPIRRIYYASLRDAPDLLRLWQSVKRRGSLPSLFFLDDC
ncbi:MAG TPA: hypothetical protein VES73_18200, partial [Lamprocystis sp. (in: g-proteobacteria)]|nr:hypothetical protein [Lamprocystis sp. (in: g-proteobacteria)]